MGEFDKAVEDINKSVEIYPKNHSLRITRSLFFIRQGKNDKALADTEQVIGDHVESMTKYNYYNAACIYSLASAQAAKDQSEADRETLARRYADRAVELLRLAVKKGWSTSQDIDHLRKNTDLNAIRKHPDLQKLLKTINTSQKSENGESSTPNP